VTIICSIEMDTGEDVFLLYIMFNKSRKNEDDWTDMM
jgi:hypothetical protein